MAIVEEPLAACDTGRCGPMIFKVRSAEGASVDIPNAGKPDFKGAVGDVDRDSAAAAYGGGLRRTFGRGVLCLRLRCEQNHCRYRQH